MRRVALKFSFYLILGGLAALIGWQARLVEALWGLSQGATGALIGGLIGLGVAALLDLGGAAVERQVAQGGGRKLLNGALFALVGTLLGLVLYLVLELIFPTGLALNLAEGTLVLFLMILGFRIGYRQENLLLELFQSRARREGSLKLLDTSVVIDGRIGDLAKTGFIEGKLIIPQFVMDELHNIADSSDSLRRRKGRRGLDILGDLRRNSEVDVETLDKDYPEIHDVDRKLILLAKELGAKIVTTDYNLNKVAKVEGVRVLNINELANAVKPRFIPGEELEVEVIDRGEEIGQGVGYLDDGTMVVVENGRRFIGKKIRAIVNSSLQTEAGKMLFVRPKSEVHR